jgi:hypothetical protein
MLAVEGLGRVAEFFAERRIVDDRAQALRQGLRIARRAQQAGFAGNNDVGHGSDGRRYDREPVRHAFDDRHRQVLMVRREHENVGFSQEALDVLRAGPAANRDLPLEAEARDFGAGLIHGAVSRQGRPPCAVPRQGGQGLGELRHAFARPDLA